MNLELSTSEKKILGLSTLVMITVLYINEGWIRHPDSSVYVNHLEFIIGNEEKPNNINPRLLLRPLIFYLSAPFYFLFGAENAIGVLNSFFYIFSGILMYRFVLSIFKDKDLAFYSSIYFVTAFPVLYWGLGILADMGTWFFLLLSLLLLRDQEPEYNSSYNFFIPIIIGFGILYKFDLLVIPIFVTLSLLHRYNFSDFPLKYFFVSFILVLFPIVINQIYVHQTYGFNYYNHFLLEIFSDSSTTDDIFLEENYAFKYTQTYRLLTFFIAFPLLFPFALLGIREIRKTNLDSFNFSLFYIISSLIIILGWGSSLSYIGAGSPRYAFLLFPVIIPLTIIGLRNIINQMRLRFDIFKEFDVNNILLSFIILFSIINLFVAIYSSEVRNFLNIWEW
tara:strand:- start:1135 stop:2313 length:1179 start_codon:yes stop_codon:yes gene_type:complete